MHKSAVSELVQKMRSQFNEDALTNLMESSNNKYNNISIVEIGVSIYLIIEVKSYISSGMQCHDYASPIMF